jgi:hypothetical protein
MPGPPNLATHPSSVCKRGSAAGSRQKPQNAELTIPKQNVISGLSLCLALVKMPTDLVVFVYGRKNVSVMLQKAPAPTDCCNAQTEKKVEQLIAASKKLSNDKYFYAVNSRCFTTSTW